MGRYIQMRHFYLECLHRAGRGRLLQIETIAGLLAMVAIPIAAYWKSVGPYMNWIPLAVFGAVFIGTIIIGFTTAPYWIAKELEEDKDRLHLQLENKAARQSAINRLWQLRSDGIVIRNKPISIGDVTTWRKDVDTWRANVLLEADKVNTNLKCYLERLDHTCGIPGNIVVISGDHELWVRITSEILLRMEEYLKKEL